MSSLQDCLYMGLSIATPDHLETSGCSRRTVSFLRPKENSQHLLLGAQDQRLSEEQDQLPCWPTGTSSGNCQETESHMGRARHTPRHPLQNHPSGHLGGWATPWLSEETLDRQHQRIDVFTRARTAHNGVPKEKDWKKECLLNRSSYPPDSHGTELD